ncbi:GtrA family protein [Cupriavidus necator]|uniref:GtrA family protein n=1 Tax=Cupriavidus necator TaxID=106590 RepID=UPI0009B81068|nr:GtrA family protein [Cupriavidus necator]
MKKVATEICSFAFVGVLGFLVDAGVLYLLKAQLGLYWGRAASFLCAASITWIINRSMTFSGRHSGQSMLREYLSYLLLMCGGGAVNYGAYAVSISISTRVAAHPIIGVAIGSLAGLSVNYVSSRFLLFQKA